MVHPPLENAILKLSLSDAGDFFRRLGWEQRLCKSGLG